MNVMKKYLMLQRGEKENASFSFFCELQFIFCPKFFAIFIYKYKRKWKVF